MDARALNTLDMFINVNQFGQDNTSDFSPYADAVAGFAAITEVIRNLRESAATQTSGAVGRTTTQKAVLRDAIRRQMKDISRTARALGTNNVGLQRLFRIPNGDNDANLIATAREFATEAANFKADFLRLAMPADFIEVLTADIEAFEQALNNKATAKVTGITATASIDDELKRGMDKVRIIDAIARNVYGNNPAKLAAWTSARHIARITTQSKAETTSVLIDKTV